MSSVSCKEIGSMSHSELDDFLKSFDTVLTDCDGVLWTGSVAIDGSPEVIQALRKLGKKVIYVTNNSTKSRKEYLTKFTDLGFGGEAVKIYSFLRFNRCVDLFSVPNFYNHISNDVNISVGYFHAIISFCSLLEATKFHQNCLCLWVKRNCERIR